MSDDQNKRHDDLRREFDELRQTVINHSGRIAGLEQDLRRLQAHVDQLKGNG